VKSNPKRIRNASGENENWCLTGIRNLTKKENTMNVKYLAKKYNNLSFQDAVGLVEVVKTPHGYGKVYVSVRYIGYTKHYPNGYLRAFDHTFWDGEGYLGGLLINGQFNTDEDGPRNVYAYALGYDRDYGPEWSIDKIEASKMRIKFLESVSRKLTKHIEKFGSFQDGDYSKYVQTVFALMGITTFVKRDKTKERGFDYIYDIQSHLNYTINNI